MEAATFQRTFRQYFLVSSRIGYMPLYGRLNCRLAERNPDLPQIPERLPDESTQINYLTHLVRPNQPHRV